MALSDWIRGCKRALSPGRTGGHGVPAYEDRLEAEAAYWADFTVRWVKSGIIPPWGDTRLAISQLIANGHQDRITGAEIENLCRRRQHLRQLLLRVRELAREGRTRVLDLGCGSGFLSLEMARQGARVTGMDCSPGQLEVARYFGEQPEWWRRHLFPRYLNIDVEPGPWAPPDYVNADFNVWEPEPGAYDVVVAHDALHHARDLDAIAAVIARGLCPGGQVLVLEHQEPSQGMAATEAGLESHLRGLVERPDEQLPLPPFDAYARSADFPAHLGLEIMTGLADRLRAAGFKVPDSVTQGPDEIPPPNPLEESAFEGADERDLGRRLVEAFKAMGLETDLYEESIDPWSPPLQELCPDGMSWPAFYARRALAEQRALDGDGLPGDGCMLWARKLI